jgi:hypothetical protein
MEIIYKIAIAAAIMIVLHVVVTFVIYVCLTIKLIKQGIDPMQYYEMIEKGKIPVLIPVEVQARTEIYEIKNRWYGK